jgi:hypothetical protein
MRLLKYSRATGDARKAQLEVLPFGAGRRYPSCVLAGYVLRRTDNRFVLRSSPVDWQESDSPQPETMSDTHSISISGEVRRGTALQYLPDQRSSRDNDGELLVAASNVTALDAWGGATIRALIEDHMSRAADGSVCVWPPRASSTFARTYDVLSVLPPRVTVSSEEGAPARDRSVVIPALRVRDQDEANNLALWVLAAAPHTQPRLSRAEAKLLATAVPTLAENGLEYAPASSCGTVICATIEQAAREVQLVTVDLGEAVARAPDPLDALRRSIRTAQAKFGGLHNVLKRAQQLELASSLDIRSGTAEAQWTDGRWHFRGSQPFVAGWAVGLTVHRER